jgi:hypothetical protein
MMANQFLGGLHVGSPLFLASACIGDAIVESIDK